VDGNEQGAPVKKLEQCMVVVEYGIHFLDILREVRKIVVPLKMVPSFAFAYFLPAFHWMFRFNNENGILRNQVNGLKIGLGRQDKNVGQIAQVKYQQSQKPEKNPFFGHSFKSVCSVNEGEPILV
jgi:hypothetical protein